MFPALSFLSRKRFPRGCLHARILLVRISVNLQNFTKSSHIQKLQDSWSSLFHETPRRTAAQQETAEEQQNSFCPKTVSPVAACTQEFCMYTYPCICRTLRNRVTSKLRDSCNETPKLDSCPTGQSRTTGFCPKELASGDLHTDVASFNRHGVRRGRLARCKRASTQTS